jgi:hypothetical protein
MTRFSTLKMLLIGAMLMLAPFSNAIAEEAATTNDSDKASAVMTINRFVACQAVEEREPVGTTDTFAAGTETAYAYLEATSISADVQVSFVWIHEEKEVARVALTIRQGNRWRTYSSKKLAGRSGSWRVEVQDAKEAVLASVDFTVE